MFLDGKIKEVGALQSDFNGAAYALPKTDFVHYLQCKFGDNATACAVLDTFEKMGIPAPESLDGFRNGAEGFLVFLNPYGVVIRIEQKSDFKESYVTPDRIDDSPWVLKPLASIDAGNAIIEVCPGCSLDVNEEKMDILDSRLYDQGIAFWDYKLSNMGCIPIKTPRFPNGLDVIIDRLAMSLLTENISSVHLSLEDFKEEQEAWEAQEELYGPLRQAFEDAWPDTQKMKQFWKLCQIYKEEEGKLVAGWNEAKFFKDDESGVAKYTAAVYGDLLSAYTKQSVVNPPAAAAVSSLTPVLV